jgi:protein SCO1/2
MTALLLGLAACGDAPGAHRTAASAPSFGTVLDAPVPSALLDLPLVDADGHRVTLGALRGRLVVVSDMMTLCQETCAIGTAAMLQAARAVDRAGLGSKVTFLSITIDPAGDDLRHLTAYRRTFGRLPNWRALTGPPVVVDRLWDRLGVWRRQVRVPRPYPRDWVTGRPLTTDIQHTDDLVFIDARQRFRFELEGTAALRSPRQVPRRIYAFMDRLGHQNARFPGRGSWSASQVTDVLQWLLRDRGAGS